MTLTGIVGDDYLMLILLYTVFSHKSTVVESNDTGGARMYSTTSTVVATIAPPTFSCKTPVTSFAICYILYLFTSYPAKATRIELC